MDSRRGDNRRRREDDCHDADGGPSQSAHDSARAIPVSGSHPGLSPLKRWRQKSTTDQGPGMKLTLSNVAVPATPVLCEHSNNPMVAGLVKVIVLDSTFVQVTPSLEL